MQIISCWKKLAIILSSLKSDKNGRCYVVILVTAPGVEGRSLNKTLVWSSLAPQGQPPPAGDRPSSFLGPVLALHHLGWSRVRRASRIQKQLPDFYCQENVEPCVGFRRDKLVRGFDLYQAKKFHTKYKKGRFVSV